MRGIRTVPRRQRTPTLSSSHEEVFQFSIIVEPWAQHLEPVQLKTLPPLRLILPTHGNARRERLEAYFAANDVRIGKIVEMDAMLATLELVAQRDFMTIVPTIFVRGALRDGRHKLNPIVFPEIAVDYAVIEPRGQILSLSAKLLLDTLRKHFDGLEAAGDASAGKDSVKGDPVHAARKAISKKKSIRMGRTS